MVLGLTGCFSLKRHGELPVAPFVKVDRILGTWYVQGAMPTLLDRTPHDATFSFTQQRDGRLHVEYAFLPRPDAESFKIYEAKATIKEIETFADWGIQFVWPFESDWKVIHVSDNYTTMIIGHPSRKYLYVLSRSSEIDPLTMEWLLDFAASRGFDTSFLKRVPQNS